MSTAICPARTSAGASDAFADVAAFVDQSACRTRGHGSGWSGPIRSRPKPPLAGAALRKVVMVI